MSSLPRCQTRVYTAAKYRTQLGRLYGHLPSLCRVSGDPTLPSTPDIHVTAKDEEQLLWSWGLSGSRFRSETQPYESQSWWTHSGVPWNPDLPAENKVLSNLYLFAQHMALSHL